MSDVTAKLISVLGEGRVKEDEPMAKHLNFRIGGPAKWFVEVKNIEEVQKVMEVIREKGIPFFILGGGSNTLVSDKGFDGLVVKMTMRSHTIDGNRVKADAGVISAALARVTASAGLKGFEWAISLPGTVGGAVRGNAGCFGGELKDSAVEATILRGTEVMVVSADKLKFGYRDSAIKHTDDVVLDVTLELEQGDPEALKQVLKNTLDARKDSQPLYAGSAGCMFKNVELDPEEVASILPLFNGELEGVFEIDGKQRISSGWLIEKMGLKGTRIGGAEISKEHGNFIINHDGATAADVKGVIDLVKHEAMERFGIEMEEEVKLVGF